MTLGRDSGSGPYKIDVDQLSKCEPSAQIEIMKGWFHERYMNPNNECPWDSEEDSFIYIWGGPFDAGDELKAEFEGIVALEVIEELVEELEEECAEWSAVPQDESTDQYFVEAISSAQDPMGNLRALIDKLQRLTDVSTPTELGQTHMRMIYVNAITAMEAYLSECFINEVMKDEVKLRAFVESYPEYKERKFPLAEVFSHREKIRETAKEHLADLIWHNLPKIKAMYKSSLNVTFPSSFNDLVHAVKIRHDLVHRGGKTKGGEEIIITASQLRGLINAVLGLAAHIHKANSSPS